MALDKNKPHIRQRNGIVDTYSVAAGVKIYQGAFVNVSSGYVVPASDSAGEYFLGEAEYLCDNSSGLAGDRSVYVRTSHRIVFETPAASLSDIGKSVYAVSDETLSLSAVSSSSCGKIVNAEDGVSWIVELVRI
jgi:hypothetical protein